MKHEDFVEAAIRYLHGQLDETNKQDFEHHLLDHPQAQLEFRILTSLKHEFEADERSQLDSIWRQIETSLDLPDTDASDKSFTGRRSRSRTK